MQRRVRCLVRLARRQGPVEGRRTCRAARSERPGTPPPGRRGDRDVDIQEHEGTSVESGRAHRRVLFIFDPHREALLLLGGDKGEDSQWNDWYITAVPAADALYENYLDETGQTDEEKN